MSHYWELLVKKCLKINIILGGHYFWNSTVKDFRGSGGGARKCTGGGVREGFEGDTNQGK